MKRYKSQPKLFFITIVIAVLICTFVLVGCNDNDNPDGGADMHTITFVTNGGSQVNPITVNEGALIILPPNPTMAGSEFVSWCTDIGLEFPLTSYNMGASDFTLYAKWLKANETYTVSFDTNGGSLVNAITYNKGEITIAPSYPTKPNNTFMGWILGGERYEFGQSVESNLTLSADWLQGEWVFNKVGENTILKSGKNIRENVVIPNNYFGSPITEIISGALKNNSIIKTITLPDSINKVGSYAFSDCSALSSISLGKIKSLGSFSFNNCLNLESASLPDSLTAVGESLFNNCLKLQEININSNTNFPMSIFEKCVSLKSIEASQANTKYFSNGGILYNKAANQIVIVPIKISGTVTLPQTLTDISKGAFMGRATITMIKVGANIKTVGSFAFYDCLNLKYVTFDGETPPTFSAKAFDQRLTTIKVKVPQSAKSVYQSALSAYPITIS